MNLADVANEGQARVINGDREIALVLLRGGRDLIVSVRNDYVRKRSGGEES
jgi:hypothetical protein